MVQPEGCNGYAEELARVARLEVGLPMEAEEAPALRQQEAAEGTLQEGDGALALTWRGLCHTLQQAFRALRDWNVFQ